MTLDLDDFVNRLRSASPDTPPPPLRQVERRPARIEEPLICRPVDRNTRPLQVSAFVDGIQRKILLRWVHHRPIVLVYACALAADTAGDIIDRLESLQVVCSDVDAAWMRQIVDPGQVHAVADADGKTIRAAAAERTKELRDVAERELSTRLVEMVDGPIVVDGPLTGHPRDRIVVGVVKSHPVSYRERESHLHDLTVGHFTWPPFEILDPDDGEPTGRLCSYLRLHPHHPHHDALHGLVRLEARDPELLEPLAVTCMGVRQGPRSGDARWPVHIEPIAYVERLARQYSTELAYLAPTAA